MPIPRSRVCALLTGGALAATALLLSAPAATAASPAAVHQRTAYTCTVRYNHTRFYVGGAFAGYVDAGQNLDVARMSGGYAYGHLWGDPSTREVSIFSTSLSCPD